MKANIRLVTCRTTVLMTIAFLATQGSIATSKSKVADGLNEGEFFTKSGDKRNAMKVFTDVAQQCVNFAYAELSPADQGKLGMALGIKENKMTSKRLIVDKVSPVAPFTDASDTFFVKRWFIGREGRAKDQWANLNHCVTVKPVMLKRIFLGDRYHYTCRIMIADSKMLQGNLIDRSDVNGVSNFQSYLLKQSDLASLSQNKDNPQAIRNFCNSHPQMVQFREELLMFARTGNPRFALQKPGIVPPHPDYLEEAAAGSSVSSVNTAGTVADTSKTLVTGRASVGAGGAGRAGSGSPVAAPLDQTVPPPVPGPATIMPEGGSLETPGGNGAQVTAPSTSSSDDGGTVPTTATTTGLTGASTSSSGTATTAAAPGAAPQGNKLGNLVDSLGILGKVGDQYDFIQPRYSDNGKRYAVSTLTYDYANGAKEEGLLINEDHFNAISQQAVSLPAIDTKSAKSEKEAADIISATVGKIAEKEVSSLSGEQLQKAENDVEVLKVRAASLFAAQMQRISAIEKKGGDTSAAYAAAEKLQAVVVYYSMKLDMIREKKYSARLGSAPAVAPAAEAATGAESSSSTTTRSSAPGSASSSSSAPVTTSSVPASPSAPGASSPAAVTTASAPTPPSPSPEPWKSEGHPAGFNISDLVIAGMNNTKATQDSQELRKFVEEADQRVAKEIETKPAEIVAANTAKIAKIDDSIKAKELEIKELEATANGEYKKVALKKAKVSLASLKYEKGKLAEESEDAVANASKRKKKQLEVLDAMLNPETGVLSYEIENIAAQARIALKSTESDAKVLERIENQNPLSKDDAAYAHVENLRSWYHYVRVRKQKYEYYKGMVQAQK